MIPPLSSKSDSAPGAVCVCSHLKRLHYAGGTCLGAYRNPETKKEADATVCPCSEFTPRT